MKNKRAVLKYAVLGSITAVYAGGIARVFRPDDLPVGIKAQMKAAMKSPPVSSRQVAIVGGSLLAATWLAGVL